jgi:hypothetical protein
MRKVTNRFAAVIMVLLMICSIPVSAISESTNRASEQIMSYYINVVPAGNGKIAIAFSIDGTGEMKNIGAESIIIYYKIGGAWVVGYDLDRYDSGMSTKDDYYFLLILYGITNLLICGIFIAFLLCPAGKLIIFLLKMT